MPVINEENSKSLAAYGITLKKESKTSSVIQLKDRSYDSKMSRNLYDKFITAAKQYSDVYRIRLPKITFGVELEFVGSNNAKCLSNFSREMSQLLRDKYFCALSYVHNDGQSWILGRDGSIDTSNTSIGNPYGFELSSPKLDLSNKDDVDTLATVIELAKKHLHAEVNKSCGTHIHIGFKPTDVHRGNICDLLSVYSCMEKTVFDPIVPAKRRRNRFCKKTLPYPREKYQKLSSRFCEFTFDGECRKLHFEFRQLEGTLDVQTILYWAQLQTYILYDLLDHINDTSYLQGIMVKNIFDILFYYNFDKSLVNFFIERVIDFKSRSIQVTP